MYSLVNNNLYECHWHLSKGLYCLFLILYGISLLIIWQLPLAFGWRMLIAVILTVYSINILLKHILFSLPCSFTGLRKTATSWLIYNKLAGWQIIQLLPTECVVLYWAVILQFRIEGSNKRLTLCLPSDVMATNDFRKLRVFLRF